MDQLIEELRFMYELDQRTREYLDYGSFNKSFTDSIERLSQEEIKIVQRPVSTQAVSPDQFLEPKLYFYNNIKKVMGTVELKKELLKYIENGDG